MRFFIALLLSLFLSACSPFSQHTKLVDAILSNKINTVKELSNPSSVKKRNSKGQTPLMVASFVGNLSIVKIILQAAAKVNTVDNNGNTALMIAAVTGNSSVVRYLFNHGAKIAFQNKNGMTALALAAKSGQTHSVTLLLANGANFYHRTKKGYSIYDLARRSSQSGTAKFLINYAKKHNLHLDTEVWYVKRY